jgi:hypothetical protein
METEKRNAPVTWSLAATPVILPESRCPFCLCAVRSNAIWFLTGAKRERLIGILEMDSAKVQLTQPNHPHHTGGGFLCLGRNLDGIALLASTPNILDAPMGSRFIPKWLYRYWGHKCIKAREYLIAQGHSELAREYDKL